jgi:hypothetical protein
MTTAGMEMTRKVSEMPQLIWQAIIDNPGSTIPELARNMGVTRWAIYYWLNRMDNISECDNKLYVYEHHNYSFPGNGNSCVIRGQIGCFSVEMDHFAFRAKIKIVDFDDDDSD